MRLNKFGIPPGFAFPAAIYGLVAGVILVLVEAPQWIYCFATLPYCPYFLHQLSERDREERAPDPSPQKRRSRGTLS
jgi:hypothetical protein